MPDTSRRSRIIQGIAIAVLLPCATVEVAAAERSRSRPAEIGEVLVSGEKPTREVADLIPWLRRLLGQYTYEGHVDLGGQGKSEDRRTVRGVGICVGFGVAPGVQCEINVRWPEVRGDDGEEVLGGTSRLDPAMILYGLEPDEIGIRYLQVDSKGLAEGATGFVIGDTATFKSPCVDVPTGCQRTTRITAGSESDFIDMQIDTELDFELATRFVFKMRRVGTVQAPANP